MARRSVLLAVLGIELIVAVVLFKTGYLSRHPVVAPMPPLEVKAYPAPPRVSSVEMRRGDTFLKALQREGVSPKIGHDIASALRGQGVNLRKLSPRHGLAIEWTLDGRPRKLTYEPSPWLGYAVISTEDGWKVERAETRPDVRVEAVSGEVRRSLFEAVEKTGE
jgi:hypothetical protein